MIEVRGAGGSGSERAFRNRNGCRPLPRATFLNWSV